MSNILGYDTTTDAATLAAFIAQARPAYQALEETIKPVDAKIEELLKDWEPRPSPFWSPILREYIPAIRAAADTCGQLFNRERSKAGAPVPIVICATSITYRCDLNNIEAKIEEAGIRLTAFLHSCFSEKRSVETQIRERQRLLSCLRELSKAVHEVVDNARAKLDEAPEEQAKLLAPRKRRASAEQSASGLKVVTPNQAEQEGDAQQ